MSMKRSHSWSCLSCLALCLLGACGDDVGTEGTESSTTDTGSGDGDGDPGDGDPGDGDGDPGDGDGDGDPGDGDGDPGDGDGDPGPQDFYVGVDVRDIDPSPSELGTIYLGGFGAPFVGGTATAVHDSVYARTMALGYGVDDGVIFTVVDAIGMGNQWTREIRETASELTGLPADRIIVATTHSHSGPDFHGLWGGVGDGYRNKVIVETTNSMLTAWDTRQLANLSVSNSSALNHNRRGWDMSDDTIFVLQARAQDDDALLGTMMSFAAHPVIIGADNTEISRDYCGYAVDALEAATGGPVVFFNGILGDVSPSVPPGVYADDFEEAAAYGEYVAAQAELMIDQAVPVEPGFAHDYVEWELPVDNALFNLAGQLGILDYDFIQNGLASSVITQSAYIRLGTQAQIVAFPGESLTRCGLPVKDAMSAPYKAVLGNAGDALGYFVPSDEWMTGLNGDYEEGVSLGETVGDTSRDEIIQMIAADVF